MVDPPQGSPGPLRGHGILSVPCPDLATSGTELGNASQIGTLRQKSREDHLLAAPQLQARLSTQLTRFVLVGGVAAMVDYGSYQLLLAVGLWVHLAKACGFIAGTTTAYLINRRWTFQGQGGRAQLASVMALYGITFVVQVGMNAVLLALLPRVPGEITIAFVIAQGIATSLNFIVQRTVIFRR
ncbi:MAG: GtrA family protein [Pseudonocardiaceae bacterium]